MKPKLNLRFVDRMFADSSIRDFAKIGVFLIGIALVILASIVLHFYITYMSKTFFSHSIDRPFNAYCTFNKVVIVSALKDLERVKILDNRSNTICLFDRMKSGSEELCIVNEYGVYIVQHDDFKDVVECFSPAAVRMESPTLTD